MVSTRKIDEIKSKLDALRNDAARLCARVDASDDRYLRTAIKHEGKVHVGDQGEHHIMLMYRLWGNELNAPDSVRGFVNHKGHFLDRQRAGEYGREHGLFNRPDDHHSRKMWSGYAVTGHLEPRKFEDKTMKASK